MITAGEYDQANRIRNRCCSHCRLCLLYVFYLEPVTVAATPPARLKDDQSHLQITVLMPPRAECRRSCWSGSPPDA
ncbi:MAG: hypothetical protein ACOYL3_18865 [Desulfuromonadaceae bacterium]